jgi:hypothetical protein
MRNCVGGFFLNVAGRPEILVLTVVAVRERLVSGSPIGSCASLACLVAEGCGGRRDVTRRRKSEIRDQFEFIRRFPLHHL